MRVLIVDQRQRVQHLFWETTVQRAVQKVARKCKCATLYDFAHPAICSLTLFAFLPASALACRAACQWTTANQHGDCPPCCSKLAAAAGPPRAPAFRPHTGLSATAGAAGKPQGWRTGQPSIAALTLHPPAWLPKAPAPHSRRLLPAGNTLRGPSFPSASQCGRSAG